VSESRLYALEETLKNAFTGRTIYVAIDDIDKRWDPRFEPSAAWLRGLLDEMNRMRKFFGPTLRTAVFLREDMFDSMKQEDTSYSNRSISALRWDREQLSEVISARIEFLMDHRFETSRDAWNAVFASSVAGKATKDYMIDRTLMRPRDLIQFSQMALERSQRRRADRVTQADILDSAGDYSKYLFESVRTEYLLTYPNLGMAMLAFHRASPVSADYSDVLATALQLLLADGVTWAKAPNDVLRALYDVGFLGLGSASRNQFLYSWSRTFEEAQRSTVADALICVHPGFHSHLEIRID
jgi:hypothetical protein